VTKYSFFGFPRVSYRHVTRDTIAIIGSLCVSKSIHPCYDQIAAARVLRKLSREYDTHNLHIRYELENYDIVDLGDYPPDKLSSIVSSVLRQNARVIVVGGDHTTTYYGIRDTELTSIAIFDAHLDSEVLDNNTFHHGCVIRRIISELPKISVRIIGFRGYSTLKRELEFVQKKNIKVYDWPVSHEVILEELSMNDAVSIDLDFFNPNSFWAVRVPEVLGVDFSEFVQLVNMLESTKSRYIDIVEYIPKIDLGFICGKCLIQLILEILALLVRST